jgi:hypothetical protein
MKKGKNPMLKNKIFSLAVIAAMVLSGSAFVSMKKVNIYAQDKVVDHFTSPYVHSTVFEGESLLPVSIGLRVQVPVQTAISTALAQFPGAKWAKVSLFYKGNTPFFAILLSNGLLAEVNAVSGAYEDGEYAAIYRAPSSEILGEFIPVQIR